MTGTPSRLNIGRVGLTITETTVKDIHTWRETSRGLSGEGQFLAADETTFEFLAGQLTGYPNEDESVTYIRSSSRPALNGWWEIREEGGLEVSRSPGRGEWAGVGNFSIDARRIRGRTVPAIEDLYTSYLAINTLGVADGEQRCQWAVPEGAFDRNGPTGGTWVTRSTETGTLAFWHNQTGAFDQALYWASNGDDYYDGACTVEQRASGGTTWFTVVGHDIGKVAPVDWRITNGCVRVTASTTASKSLQVEWWNGTDWSTPKHFAITGNTFGTIAAPTSVSVERNAIEEVRIKLTWDSPSVSSSGRISTHLGIRRGDRMIRVVHRSDVANQWRLASGESSTDIDNSNLTVLTAAVTAGVFTTSNDADGNRAFIATHMANTTNAGAGASIIASTTEAVWVIGLELGGTSAAAENEWESEVLGAFAPTSELNVVRGR